ncbi:tetracycline resistance MFS efflux pump [Thermopolyspora flexuosa]|jgi:DHA1 family tetracycline resistance protein-like MFS transporter|uniref:DHA1 family tetracycline resistance protein-like MFS transporter n=1 Tax=Thermopolyspora flexuosa TaxID=103836 RepID=A0A543ISK9_9ACTN|nr:DHA1 family tetracycline resistance protein-like MFS transporter [Thermopolyspora flexuosa]GGM82243.1 tetracycline resistance MFS efflux pump [Thermopolyspora flexuosa]
MRRRALPVIYLAVFVDMLGFGIILPLLPFHAEQLGGSGLWVGGVLTAYAAAQFVAGPVLGLLSDRFGRRPVLLAALLGSAVSLALTGLANSLLTLFAARLVAGLCGGAIPVGQAYVVDLTEPRERTKALGMVGASIGMGFVFGPAIGAALSGLGFAGVSFVAGGIALANFLAGLLLLPRQTPARTAEQDGGRAPRNASPAVLVTALRVSSMRPVLIAIFAGTFAFTGMEATYALLGERLYDLGPAGLGIVFTGVGLVMAAVQGGLVGKLSARYGDRRVAVGGTLLMAVGLLALPLGVTWLNYVGLAVLAAGQGLMTTATSALIAEAAGAALGGAFGVGQSSSAAARAISPVAAGAAFDVHLALPYYLGTVLCVAAALLLRRRPAAPAPAPSPAEAVKDDQAVS